MTNNNYFVIEIQKMFDKELGKILDERKIEFDEKKNKFKELRTIFNLQNVSLSE